MTTTTPDLKLARIPRATYRLQFNRDFTLRQATELVPYLDALGVSHCYASPLLAARKGSPHGYDIVDHNSLNPEIGTREDLAEFAAALHANGMGLMLDVVPNHMGIMGADNGWWLDVLENGPASRYAGYFDIDFAPLRDDLRGRVLLPVLGDHYGDVLERSELQLSFDAALGQFEIRYHEHRFPIDPREYPAILGARIDVLRTAVGSDHPMIREFLDVVEAFADLPPRHETGADKVAERAGRKEICKRMLAVLCKRLPQIAWFIDQNLRQLNGTPGEPSSFDELHRLINAQAYRLAFWRVASDEINYRRFFDINDLAALRMEEDAVFDATHRLILDLVEAGYVDALRLDHPDGLFDPGRYFRRLQEACAERIVRHRNAADQDPDAAKPAIYLVIEKILAEHERPPEDWLVHGTTGYRFCNVLNGLFVDASAADKMSRGYAAFIDQHIDFDELVYASKRLVMRTALAGESNVLANRLARIAMARRQTSDYTLNALHDALMQVVACFPTYRTYVSSEGISEQDRRTIDWAVAAAKRRSRAADTSVFDFLRNVLNTDIAIGRHVTYREEVVAFAMRFQQYTAPVMAKGFEDTALYNYHRLVSLNEVGGEPRTFGFSLAAFHGASLDRVRNWPHTMVTSSTHDSKRSEDMRARIDVLSEVPAAWRLALRRWSRLSRRKKRLHGNALAPTRNDEYLLYQTLLGIWPLQTPDDEMAGAVRERVEAYMIKAVREAKTNSSWINPDEEYEQALREFIGALLDTSHRNLFMESFLPFQADVARHGLLNILSQTLLKLTVPGVPDIYQGSEMLEFRLVDPDNRRPVNYAMRQASLAQLQALPAGPALAPEVRKLLDRLHDGMAKLHVTRCALALRRRFEPLFREGSYVPLATQGIHAEHLCAFARQHGNITVIVIVPRLYARLLQGTRGGPPIGAELWQDTRVTTDAVAPGTRLINQLTGETIIAQPFNGAAALAAAELFANFPLALLSTE